MDRVAFRYGGWTPVLSGTSILGIRQNLAIVPAFLIVLALLPATSSVASADQGAPCYVNDPDPGQELADFQCSVSGVVFEDLSANGVRDSEYEPALAGWTVFADLDHDGVAGGTDPVARSDQSGAYKLFLPENAAYGPFEVRAAPVAGWHCVAPSAACVFHEKPFIEAAEELDLERTGRNFGFRRPGIGPTVKVKSRSRAGRARLRLPRRCQSRSFRATVRGKRIANVSFFIDDRKRLTVIAPDRRGRFTYRVRVAKLRRGRHVVRVLVTFKHDSRSRSRNIRRSFRRCPTAAAGRKQTS